MARMRQFHMTRESCLIGVSGGRGRAISPACMGETSNTRRDPTHDASHVVNTTAKVVPQTSTRVTPAGGDDDWETF